MQKGTSLETLAGTDRRSVLALAALTLGGLGFVRPSAADDRKEAITQTATFEIDPERLDQGVALLSDLVKAVEKEEPDVLAYLLYQEEENPHKVFFFEVYKDSAALVSHGQQPHLEELRNGFTNGLLRPPVAITKMKEIAGVRRSG